MYRRSLLSPDTDSFELLVSQQLRAERNHVLSTELEAVLFTDLEAVLYTDCTMVCAASAGPRGAMHPL